jgi:MYXO-CTERM domain-containing protein
MGTLQTGTTGSYDGWIGRDAYDSQGEKIGEIKDVFYDDRTGRPEWLTVSTGLFKGNTFVPIHGAQIHHDPDAKDADGDNLRLAYTKGQIKDAPRIDTDVDLTPAQEQELWTFYGYDYADTQNHGYGTRYDQRPDQEFQVRPYDSTQQKWSDTEQTWAAPSGRGRQGERMEEHTEEVPVKTTAQVEVPVDTTVRLRRYQTQEQKTRMVEIPYTETTEHTEVADVEARAGQPTTTKGAAQVGTSKPVTRNTPTTIEVETSTVERTVTTLDSQQVDTDDDDESDKTGLWGLLGLLGLAGLAGLKRRNEPTRGYDTPVTGAAPKRADGATGTGTTR